MPSRIAVKCEYWRLRSHAFGYARHPADPRSPKVGGTTPSDLVLSEAEFWYVVTSALRRQMSWCPYEDLYETRQ